MNFVNIWDRQVSYTRGSTHTPLIRCWWHLVSKPWCLPTPSQWNGAWAHYFFFKHLCVSLIWISKKNCHSVFNWPCCSFLASDFGCFYLSVLVFQPLKSRTDWALREAWEEELLGLTTSTLQTLQQLQAAELFGDLLVTCFVGILDEKNVLFEQFVCCQSLDVNNFERESRNSVQADWWFWSPEVIQVPGTFASCYQLELDGKSILNQCIFSYWNSYMKSRFSSLTSSNVQICKQKESKTNSLPLEKSIKKYSA